MLIFYLSLADSPEDEEKITFIYNNCKKYMMYRANKVIANKSDTEDAVHTAFLRIIKHIKKIDISDPVILKGLCGRIAENIAKDMNRSQKNSSENLPFDDGIFESSDVSGIPDEIMFRKETYDKVYEIILSMDRAYKDVCILKFICGMDNKEISSMLGVNYSTVGVYILRGRQIIIKALKEADVHE